jgi:hypothetical protein
MTSADFKPAIPANERRKTHALDRAATGIKLRTKLYSVNSGQHTDVLSVTAVNQLTQHPLRKACGRVQDERL